MSKLVIVPTPIGNLEDITLRAIRILGECDFILAEDTRDTGKLLKHLDIQKSLRSYHIHNEHKTLDRVIDQIEEVDLAVLVSDAGTPAISDPGFLLVRGCIARGIKVECLPGATAFVPALVGSGLACDRFVFEGFLPHKKGRQTKITSWLEEERTIVIYESPHRLVKSLEQLVEFLGPERNVCVVREISKVYEEFQRGTAEEVLKHYQAKPPKGEIVVVIEGVSQKPEKKEKKSTNKYR